MGQGPLSSAGGWLTPFCQNCLEKQPSACVHWDNLALRGLAEDTTFLHLQRTVSQEALEPHLPLPHQCRWRSVNLTSLSCLRKINSEDILPISFASTQWQAHILLSLMCVQMCFPDQDWLLYIFSSRRKFPASIFKEVMACRTVGESRLHKQCESASSLNKSLFISPETDIGNSCVPCSPMWLPIRSGLGNDFLIIT